MKIENMRNSLINIEQAKIEVDNALYLGLILGSLATFFLVDVVNKLANNQPEND